MSVANEDEAVTYECDDVNSSYLFPLFDYDSSPDVINNQPLFDNEIITLTQVTKIHIDRHNVLRTVRSRHPWGYGRDAMRCARFRNYPVVASPIFRYLSQGNEEITKASLQRLIDLCIASCPKDLCPKPPTRSQKRVKAGLVYWLDKNSICVMKYLASQFIQG
jgi:hypothetical protein